MSYFQLFPFWPKFWFLQKLQILRNFDFWKISRICDEIFDFLTKTSILIFTKIRNLTKFLIKFRPLITFLLLTKFRFFDDNLDFDLNFCDQHLFLMQNLHCILRFFDQNFDFWPKFWFLTKILIFDQNFDFWPKFQFLSKIYFYLNKSKLWMALAIKETTIGLPIRSLKIILRRFYSVSRDVFCNEIVGDY